jgi:hypothetical protein
MNHTTLGTIVAISVIAALTVGVAIISTPKALAQTGDFPITTSIQGVQISDLNGNPIVSTTVPDLSGIIPGLPGQAPSSTK